MVKSRSPDMRHLRTCVSDRLSVPLGLGVFILGLVPLTTNAATPIMYGDGTFEDGDWTLIIRTLVGGGTVTAYQSATGGSPGEFRRIINTVNGPGGSAVLGFHIHAGATYDPSTQGPIRSVDYSEDSIMFSGFGEGQASGPALLQAGEVYRCWGLVANQYTWTIQFLSDQVATDFVSLSGSNPDFSQSGAPISFGFWRGNWTTNHAYTIDAGIDNWSLMIHPDTATLTVTEVNGGWGEVVLDPGPIQSGPPQYKYACDTSVTLTANPLPGKEFVGWAIYDPNYPGDPNYVDHDTNTVLYLVMDADWEVEARFKCGSSAGPFIPLVLLGLAGFAMRRRRR